MSNGTTIWWHNADWTKLSFSEQSVMACLASRFSDDLKFASMTQGAIHKKIGGSMTTIKNGLNRLEENGWIKRTVIKSSGQIKETRYTFPSYISQEAMS